MNIKEKSIEELEVLCEDIRQRILEVVSKNGGHLSSTLGATELIVAMHYVFDSKKDPFIFDVSHQSYAHKLLTGRWDSFESLRQFGGICGYTKPSESDDDYFVAGHSSTSISLGVGAAKAIALKHQEGNRIPVVMIGDGSMTAGMVYEALNELGDRSIL
jgi:1-deoxy-D-xylulose-5-phosphate synthase